MIVSFVGHSNAGKTTLLCAIVSELKKRGYSVAVIKHTERVFSFKDFDTEGKDTFRFSEAGADYVVLSSEGFSFLEINKTSDMLEMTRLLKADFILIEGFKEEDIPKIVLTEKEEDLQPIKGKVLAVISESLPGAIKPEETDRVLSLLMGHRE